MRLNAGAVTACGKFSALPALAGRNGQSVDDAERSREICATRREEVAIVSVLREQQLSDCAECLLLRICRNVRSEGRIDHDVLHQIVELVELKHIHEECTHGVFETQ